MIFGAAALWSMNQEQADELLDVLLAHRVNHLDVAASYGDAELRLAPWLAAHRDRFFLATKTGERTAGGARAELERSLERLGVDSLDLIQLHNLVEPDDWEVVHGPGGAVAAMAQARDEGLVRSIGVTGPRTSASRPCTAAASSGSTTTRCCSPTTSCCCATRATGQDVEELLATCAERGVAVQTIKAMARRRWTDEPGAAPQLVRAAR